MIVRPGGIDVGRHMRSMRSPETALDHFTKVGYWERTLGLLIAALELVNLLKGCISNQLMTEEFAIALLSKCLHVRVTKINV